MTDFWLGVVQTTIGSALGFILGIGAFHYQQKRQSEAQTKADRRAALDALNRLVTAAGLNIEALANAKLQLINALRPEVEMMRAAVEDLYETPPAVRAEKVAKLKALSESLQHFYMSLPRTLIVRPPEVAEYFSLSKEMPALPTFTHRAMGMMQGLDERIVSRNALIAEHAREGGSAVGMTVERLIYYSGMLADEGKAICEHADFALDFWKLVADQVKAYMNHKAKGEHFVEYQLAPKAIEALPKEELFPAMRAQLATFED